ncbi:hypothetical protein [Roseibium salinum]|uniref:Uncharacterized protein n=1 Tax=Roseibium salinum TaxID=1604349 RepID=A0ABT3R6J4_9HYPH|nr:hypothetical protein [Roseibium sp. DSM 29163]MCX2724720.1 hypothetical protein [Roseibium sp. DSM 29163]
MKLKTPVRQLVLWCCLVPVISGGSPVNALSLNDESDTYRKIWREDLVDAYAETLAAAGESTTGNFFIFSIKGCSPDDAPDQQLYIHSVQDRGLPRGSEFPTFVLTTGSDPEKASLAYKTYAGKRIYLSNMISCEKTRCLLSAKKGFSDICLADTFGNPAPDLPGLRKDFWTDLLGVLGL